MKHTLLLLGMVAFAAPVAAQDTIPLKVGAVAPDFSLKVATQNGVEESPLMLSDLRDQTVVIAFFYKARTKG